MGEDVLFSVKEIIKGKTVILGCKYVVFTHLEILMSYNVHVMTVMKIMIVMIIINLTEKCIMLICVCVCV